MASFKNTKFNYEINLTETEADTLSVLAYWEYFPPAVWEQMFQSEMFSDQWLIPEGAAHILTEHVDVRDKAGYDWFPCAGAELEAKLVALCDVII